MVVDQRYLCLSSVLLSLLSHIIFVESSPVVSSYSDIGARKNAVHHHHHHYRGLKQKQQQHLHLPKNVTLKCSADDQKHQTPDSCNVCVSCCKDFSLPENRRRFAGKRRRPILEEEEACAACYKRECVQNGPSWNGPSYTIPKIHYSPQCFWADGWHDIAGAITHRGIHHVFAGCDTELGGWHHGASEDLVHFTELPGAPRRINETYKGMRSFLTPCSGFITIDDYGIPAAGFRQCGSSSGVEGQPHPWDVPMEVRLAKDEYLTEWGDPVYLFNMSFYRGIPYDPARPWIDSDNNWYMLVSTDACNQTTQSVPCEGGGAATLYVSTNKLHDKDSNWKRVGDMYSSPHTVIPNARLTKEFVTIDYIGALANDPNGGETRVLFNNVGGNGGGEGCCSGTTSYTVGLQKRKEETTTTTTNGGGSVLGKEFIPISNSNFNGTSMVDWGSFGLIEGASDKGLYGIYALNGTRSRHYSMAKTLGSEESNQVLYAGRRVMFGWFQHDNGNSALTLGRDLSLGDDFTLQQRFVPELKRLRIESSYRHLTTNKMKQQRQQQNNNNNNDNDLEDDHDHGNEGEEEVANPGPYAEIFAKFYIKNNNNNGGKVRGAAGSIKDFGLSVMGCSNSSSNSNTNPSSSLPSSNVLLTISPQLGLAIIDATSFGKDSRRGGPLLFSYDATTTTSTLSASSTSSYHIHAIIDASIIEMIVNNQTAISISVPNYDESCTHVSLFGVSSNDSNDELGEEAMVSGTADVWAMREANQQNSEYSIFS